MDDATITAGVRVGNAQSGGTIDVTAEQITLSHSTVDARSDGIIGLGRPSAGRITFNVGTFSVTDSAILAFGGYSADGGPVTIQGLNGSGTFAHSVSLLSTNIDTRGTLVAKGGPILLSADKIGLNQSTVRTRSDENIAGTIRLRSTDTLDIQNSTLDASAQFGRAGTIDLVGEREIVPTNALVDAHPEFSDAPGSVTMIAPLISLSSTRVNGGAISLWGTKAVSLTNGTMLSAFSFLSTGFNADSIQINAGTKFISQQSTITAPGHDSAARQQGDLNGDARHDLGHSRHRRCIERGHYQRGCE
jgi:hypothetical protein